MCATGSGEQETVCEDADVTAEQFREECDVRTAGAGEPGTDFLLSASLRSTPAPTHLALALRYDLGHKHTDRFLKYKAATFVISNKSHEKIKNSLRLHIYCWFWSVVDLTC